MSCLSVPAVLAGLVLATSLLATAALSDDGPRARGHTLGADMARLGTAADPGAAEAAIDPGTDAACAGAAGDCPADRVARSE